MRDRARRVTLVGVKSEPTDKNMRSSLLGCRTSYAGVEDGVTVSSVTDEQLVAAVQGGDMQSLGQLVVRWERPLYRFVSRMVPRPEDARDVCQETFLRVLKRADRFRAGSRFSTWMYQIALNLCRDQARWRRRWGKIVDESVEAPTETTAAAVMSPEAGTERNELARAVQSGLQEIPPEQREVLIMKEYEGLKFKEIAEILEVPLGTVMSRLYRGRKLLETAMLDYAREPPGQLVTPIWPVEPLQAALDSIDQLSTHRPAAY